jgi:hypothetical protein
MTGVEETEVAMVVPANQLRIYTEVCSTWMSCLHWLWDEEAQKAGSSQRQSQFQSVTISWAHLSETCDNALL